MQIDWTTFALEIVNFLALIWILKRFLYRPVLEILNQRRAGVERTLAEAKETEVRASVLKAQFESRLADWEKEKAAARTQFEAVIAAERARQMQILAKTLAEERERNKAQEAHLNAESRRESDVQAIAQARRFAGNLLARLAGPELEARLVDIFIEDFSKLPDDRIAGLRTATGAPQTRATVASAFPLSEAQRKKVVETIDGRLGGSLGVDFRADASLLSGLRVSVGPWQLNLSLADELAYFAASSNHAD